MKLIRRLGAWHRKRMVRLGIIAGPDDGALSAPGPGHYAGASWFVLCIAAWTAMYGALIATAPLLAGSPFLVHVGVLMVLAFPTAYYLHFSRVSRRVVNATVLILAVGCGVAEVLLLWPQGGVEAFYGLTASFRVLLQAFLWVMAFRAFTLRTLTDIVLSIIPAMSCVILSLVAMATAITAVGTALVIVSCLYLLSCEYSAASEHSGDAVKAVRRVVWERGPRRGAAVNTWQAVSVVVLVAALFAGAGASYTRKSSQIGAYAKEMLARYLAGFLVGPRVDYSSAALVWLTGDSPPGGDRVLFTVECERGENWRQQAYATYTGRSWQVGRSGARPAIRRADGWHIDTTGVSGFRPTGAIQVKQVFHLSVPMAASLPALFCATRLDLGAMRARVHSGEAGTVNCAGYVRPGRSYEVISLVPAGGPGPRTDPLPPLSDDLRRQYLQLPDEMPARVRDLAREITQEATGDYDAALIIQNYLSGNYPYTLKPPARPRGQDFVDHFLFDAKTGYCNHYASAMAVLCRCIGIPARFATGFVAGEVDVDTDTYEVRAKDAHSWVEIYIEGRGWQTFEPTPPLGDEETGPLAGLRERLQALVAALAAARRDLPQATVWTAGGAAVCVVCLLGALAAHRRGQYLRLTPGGRVADPGSRCQFAHAQMTRWLARVGFPRDKAQPPLEYLATLTGTAEPVVAPAQTVTDCYMRARYARRSPSEQDAIRAQDALRAIRDAVFRDKLAGG